MSGEESGILSLQGYGQATEISPLMLTLSLAWEMLKILADGYLCVCICVCVHEI